MPSWGSKEIATASLGGAVVVFFAGATAAVAAGASPPTALWAAGGSVTGGLLGFLAPAPANGELRDAAINTKKSVLNAAQMNTPEDHTAALPQPTAATAPVVESAAHATPWAAVWLLVGVFLVLLAGAFVLAAGAVTPPKDWGNDSLQNLTKTVVALASAAGTGVIGLLSPSPTSAST